jgi:hypothetical protein
MTWGQIALSVRTGFPERPDFTLTRNLSIAKALVRRWGLEEASQLVEGAKLLKWRDLRGLQAEGGVGLRWARARYWQENNRRHQPVPEGLREVLRQMSQ